MKRIRVWFNGRNGDLAELTESPEVRLQQPAGTIYGAAAQLICLFPKELGIEVVAE